MKNNEVPLIPPDENNRRVVNARNRLIRLYNSLRQKGGWREVSRVRGSKNQQYIYNFAIHGVEPHNPSERKACFLPARICETCKRPIRANSNHEHKNVPEWMMKWRRLPKEKRDEAIKNYIEKVTGT